jgi:hypothetical protein
MDPRVTVDVDDASETFDFLGRLRRIVADAGARAAAVMGGGALPLLSCETMTGLVATLTGGAPGLVTNNLFSGDLTGWAPAEAIERVDDVPRDNVLPRRLRDQAGLVATVLPRTTATQFDIDTPADLAVLALHEGTPAGLVPADAAGMLPLAAYRGLMGVLCDGAAELVVAGRVGSATWQYLERETACRVRVISEERGLGAAGPGHRARSVLGYLLEDHGAVGLFERLGELGDAVVLDTRVIAAHLGATWSREDRFQSDLLAPGNVRDRLLRELTEAAVSCPVPVILGGHSLVSGGLMALTDAAWLEHDRLAGG